MGEELASLGIKNYHAENKIPFSSPKLQWMTYGGIPSGILMEISGREGSSKTTLSLDLVANAQRKFPDKSVVYIDAENTLDANWAEKIGVDISNLILLSPTNQSAEWIFSKAIELLDTGEVSLMVIDSIGVLVSAQALEKTIEEDTMAGIAKALTNFSKQAVGLCKKYGTTLIGINQVRDVISYGGGVQTTGGNAWKHNCFSGNTLFVTDRGLRRFRDCIDGEEVVVVDKDGELRQAVVHHYGKQQLQRVKLRTPNMNHELLCTPDHRWMLADGTITENLKVGDKLYYRPENINHSIVTKRQADMFCLGMAIADGTDRRRQCKDGEVTDIKVVLCNDKEQYESLFIKAGYRKFKEGDNYCYVKNHTSKQSFLNGEGWKYLSAEDNRYLFEGYYAGDGHKTNGDTACITHDKRVLAFIKYTCNMAGYFITSIKKHITGEQSYKPGQEGYFVTFTTHTNKYSGWVVYQIEPTNYIAGTYCVEEPVTQTFTLEKGIVTGNCSVRLQTKRGDYIDEKRKVIAKSAENPYGNLVTVAVLKTKAFRNDRRVASYTLTYHEGIDKVNDAIEMAEIVGVISRAGAFYDVTSIAEGEPKIQGKEKLKTFLESNPEILDKLIERVYTVLNAENTDGENNEMKEEEIEGENKGETIPF